MPSPLRTILTPALLSVVVACTGGGGAEDGRDSGFGGSDAKFDSEFTACQLSEVLNFVNESNTNVNRLKRHGLSENVSTEIVDHRLGPDGDLGTGDDDIYDDLDELDSVPFVGPVVLDHLVAAILNRCEVDLETRPFINEDTFAGNVGGGFSRDAVELEAAMTVGGITGQMLHDILFSPDGDDTVFGDMARARLMEAFSYGYDIDEMPWDGDSHDLREGLALLPLTIENGRYTPDDDGGVRELRLGTDIMDDVYFDSFDYRLLRSDMVLRGRIRWDMIDVVRRLLIAVKFGSEVDDNGIKRAAKQDVRTEGGTHVPTLEHDVMAGTVPWTGSPRPIEPVRELYFRLKDLSRLPDIGQHRDVLVLDPKVHLRSTRGRYHLDLASLTTMRNFYNHGRQRVRDLIADLEAAVASGSLSAADQSQAQALIAMGEGIDDGSLIADRARADLLAIDPGMTVTVGNINFPDELSSSTDEMTLEKNRVVAETVSAVFHEFGEGVDEIDRAITGTGGLDFDDFVDMFVEWQRDKNSDLSIIRTHKPFLDEWQRIDGFSGIVRTNQFNAFNNFAQDMQQAGDNDFEDFEPMTEEIFAALGKHLAFEANKEAQRQVEAAGSMALALWFDQAREFYVPSSSRPFGNFMIDTVDVAEMLTREEWIGIPEADRGIDQQLDPAKIFHTMMVNEVQIELGNEEPYVERIEELSALVADGSATDEDRRNLDGARFVFEAMVDALSYLATVKEDPFLDRLEDEGAPGTVTWEPSDESKGIKALLILGDLD